MDATEIPKIIGSNGEVLTVEMTIEQFNDFIAIMFQYTADEEYNAGYEFGSTKPEEIFWEGPDKIDSELRTPLADTTKIRRKRHRSVLLRQMQRNNIRKIRTYKI